MKFLKFIILFFSFQVLGLSLVFTAGDSAGPENKGTEIAGKVAGVLGAGQSPYIVKEDLLVPRLRQLVIKPGVQIIFKKYTKIVVEGNLSCQGEPDQPIRFTAGDDNPVPGAWDGIYVNTSESGADIANCVIEYSTFGIYCQYPTPTTIRHNRFQHNKLYSVYCVAEANPVIADNEIVRGNYGIVCYEKSNPTISGNFIHETVISGIYCFIGASPHIENNIITGSEGNAVFCVDNCTPLIEYNLFTKNLSGITVTNSSPLIINNSINHNHLCGIICSDSSPQIRFNNLYLNNLYHINILGQGTVTTAQNWWGEESYVTSLDDQGRPVQHLSRDKINGTVVIFDYAKTPYDFPFEQPQTVSSIEIFQLNDTTWVDNFYLGDYLVIRARAADRNPSVPDHLSMLIQNQETKEIIMKIMVAETGPATGVYERKMRMSDVSLRFLPKKDSKFNVPYVLVSPANKAVTKVFHIVNRKPEAREFKVATGSHKTVSAYYPFAVSWVYFDPDSVPNSQTQFHIQISLDRGFDEDAIVFNRQMSSDTTRFLVEGASLNQATLYYARIRVADYHDWGRWTDLTFKTNTWCDPPVPVFPKKDMVLRSGLWASLVARKVADPDHDQLSYLFEVFEDSGLKKLFQRGPGEHKYEYYAWTPTQRFQENATYWWRTGVHDGLDTVWSSPQSFCVNMIEEPIQPFGLQYPPYDTTLVNGRITFQWEPTSDPDPNDRDIRYSLWLAKDREFEDKIVVNDIRDNRYDLDLSLEEGSTYLWKVKAVAAEDNYHWSNTTTQPYSRFKVVKTAPVADTPATQP